MYTNTESTEKPQYINVETYLNQSWAEAVEEEQQEREVKPKTAWATIQQTDDAPGLADIVAEEQKRANAAAAKKQAYRPPVQTTAPTPGAAGYNKDYYRSSPRSERPTTPREKVPIPNEPPYTAFIGNLHYSVAESHIREFFEELGIETVQLLKAEDGQSKGFGYIRFESRDGLEKALLANGHEFHGRPLNMDVAKPLTSKLNTSWGTGGRDSFRGNTGNRPAERDTTWGSGNRERGSFRNSFTRPPANRDSRPTMDRPTERPTERPKSMQNPPQHSGLHEIAAKPKGSYSENPFGTNLTPTQIEKMNQLANDRLQKEKERDEKKRAEEKKKADERAYNERKPPGKDARSGESWRTNTNFTKPAPANFSRRDDPRDLQKQPDRKPKPVPKVDNDGFREVTHGRANRGWETLPPKPPGEQKQKITSHKTAPLENRNLFANLEEENLN